MGYEAETAKVGNYSVIVEVDDAAGIESPREWDNLGTFYTEHRNHSSPDEIPGGDLWRAVAAEFGIRPRPDRGYDGRFIQYDVFEDDPKRIMAALDRHAIWLPVWVYDHSGVTYSASGSNPFTCPWDSGLVGLIYVSKAKVREEYGVKRIGAKLRRQVESVLEGEVSTYSDWASGEVFGWIVQDRHGETVESCWGYIGDSDYCLSEGVNAAKYFVAKDRKARAERLKDLIRNRVPLVRRPGLLGAATA